MSALSKFDRRKNRVRRQLRKVASGRPRLSVYRSSKNIYAQVIDDDRGLTLAAASTLDKDLRDQPQDRCRQGGGGGRRQDRR